MGDLIPSDPKVQIGRTPGPIKSESIDEMDEDEGSDAEMDEPEATASTKGSRKRERVSSGKVEEDSKSAEKKARCT